MSAENTFDSDTSARGIQAASISVAMRALFEDWLKKGNARKHSSSIILACMDKASAYAVDKKIPDESLWICEHANVFSLVYKRLIEAKMFRVTDRKAYKVFITAGQLYLRFLKEHPYIQQEVVLHAAGEKSLESVVCSTVGTPKNIDADVVVTWLTTQLNAKGTLYLENVARTYMSALRNAPKKLKLDASVSRNVFECVTVDEFDKLWAVFKAAPNYFDINRKPWHGQLSAGLAVYRRYLEYIERGDNNENTVIQTAESLSRTVDIASDITLQTVLNPKMIEKLTTVLSTHFLNGYRLDSPIELVRFRLFAKENLGEELSLTDEDLKNYIAACGMNYEGKIYVVTIETKARIKDLVEEYFAEGAQAIFFDAFYAKNENWLLGASIVSEEMLAAFLRRLFPKLFFTRTYFGGG